MEENQPFRQYTHRCTLHKYVAATDAQPHAAHVHTTHHHALHDCNDGPLYLSHKQLQCQLMQKRTTHPDALSRVCCCNKHTASRCTHVAAASPCVSHAAADCLREGLRVAAAAHVWSENRLVVGYVRVNHSSLQPARNTMQTHTCRAQQQQQASVSPELWGFAKAGPASTPLCWGSWGL